MTQQPSKVTRTVYITGGMYNCDEPCDYRSTSIEVTAESLPDIYEGAKAWAKENFGEYNSIQTIIPAPNYAIGGRIETTYTKTHLSKKNTFKQYNYRNQ